MRPLAHEGPTRTYSHKLTTLAVRIISVRARRFSSHEFLVHALPNEGEGPEEHVLDKHVRGHDEVVEAGSGSEDQPWAAAGVDLVDMRLLLPTPNRVEPTWQACARVALRNALSRQHGGNLCSGRHEVWSGRRGTHWSTGRWR